MIPSLHFPGFQVKRKDSYIQFFKTSHFKNSCSNPPGESILLKFCQNVTNSKNLKVTKFGGSRLSLFRVMVNNLMVRAKKPPPVPPAWGFRVK